MDIIGDLLNGDVNDCVDKNAEVEEVLVTETLISKGRTWIHQFYLYDKNKSSFICSLCRKHLKEGSKGSTGNLHNHFKTCHAEKYEEARSSAPGAKKPKLAQPSLNECVQRKPNERLTQEGFMKRFLKFALQTDQPFNIGQSLALTELVDYISKDVEATKLPGRTKTTSLVENEYKMLRYKLETTLLELPSKLSLVIDCWTSSNQIAYQGVIARFIDTNWKLTTVALDLTPLSGPHTGENIAHALKNVLDNFKITAKVLAITTDNASNMDTFFASFKTLLEQNGLNFDPINQRIRCLAHIINLCAKDIIDIFEKSEATKDSIDKLRKGANGIRASPQRREAYLRQCEEKESPKVLPILDVRTRWNSTYDMIERAIQIQIAFMSTLKANVDLRSFSLSEANWDQLKQLMEFLSPLKEATIMISKETTPNIASTTLIYHYMLQHFEKFKTHRRREKNRHPDWLIACANAGSEKLEKYYPESDGKVYVVGTVLHPGFKLEWYKRANWPETWVKNCRSIVTAEWEENYKQKPAVSEGSNGQEDLGSSDFFSNLYRSQMATTSNTPVDELKKYLSEPVVKEGIDGTGFLEWWKSREKEYPNLSRMAKDYLAVAGSGVPVERMFSTGTDILSDDRQRLSTEHIQMLMCLKYWMKMS